MDTTKYEKNKNFERNRAIFVLYAFDGQSPAQIAENFSMDAQEVKNIITTHEKYEALMKE